MLLTLFVGVFTKSALAVTFALLSGRLVSWIFLPLLGRFSDTRVTFFGRRVPLILMSLVLMGICLYLIPSSDNYLTIVGLIALARIGSSIYSLSGFSVVPEVMGRQKWITSYVLILAFGVFLSGLTKFNAILTWHQGNIYNYGHVFRLAGLITIFSAAVVLLTVRESSSFKAIAKRDREQSRYKSLLKDAAELIRPKNAKVVITGALLFWMGTGATSTLIALFLEKDIHLSGSSQIIFGTTVALLYLVIGLPIGLLIAVIIPRKAIAISAPAIGAVLFILAGLANNVSQLLILSILGAPLIFAYLIALSRFYLLLIPPQGGLGERLGIFSAPFSLINTLGAFGSALLVDSFYNNYRLIWIFPAVCGFLHGLVMIYLKVEPEFKKITTRDLKILKSKVIKRINSQKLKHRPKNFLAYLFQQQLQPEDIDGTISLDFLRSLYNKLDTADED